MFGTTFVDFQRWCCKRSRYSEPSNDVREEYNIPLICQLLATCPLVASAAIQRRSQADLTSCAAPENSLRK